MQPPARQRGVTTLAITLIVLLILSLMVLFSTNVGFFEQRTTTNENRAVVTEQLAEYALNLSGEYLKANRAHILSDAAGTGWFATGAEKWKPCPVLGAAHPCDAERDPVRRAGMYYFDNVPTTPAIDGLPYSGIAANMDTKGGALTGAGTARFASSTTVNALMCRIDFDTTNPTNPIPRCALNPPGGRNVALTLVADVSLGGESAAATVKETWATIAAPMPSAAVPLIASGTVKGLGNGQVVAAPNAGGYGVAATIWSPRTVGIGDPACPGDPDNGIGSFMTCHLGEFLQGNPRENLLTACAGPGNSCGCPAMSTTGVDSLSGHSGGTKRESYDVLDADGGCGGPDITFFPLESATGPSDDDNDPTDDSLFEFIFNVDYVVNEDATTVNTNCGSSGTQNCAAYVLVEEFGATQLTNCSTLNTTSSGIFYVTGDCDLHDIGSPTNSVIVVVDGNVSINGNFDFYGLLFARSDNAASNADRVQGNGSPNIFGSLMVEGAVNVNGGLNLIYQDVSASGTPYGPIPQNVRFGKVSGSWLDSRVGI